MPEWSNQIPSDPRGPALPILRTPARKPLVAIVTSQDLIGCMTHYYKSRTMPCEGPDCPAHQAGIPYRWHAYFAAWEQISALHFLFEVTAQAAQHFVTYREAHGSLRGCKFRATRWRQNPNGRVLIECKPADIVTNPIPVGPDLIAVLSILWNLPQTQMSTDIVDSHEATAVVSIDRTKDIFLAQLKKVSDNTAVNQTPTPTPQDPAA